MSLLYVFDWLCFVIKTFLWVVGGVGRTHGAPYRGYGYVPLRYGGTSLGELEHNNNNCGRRGAVIFKQL